VGSQQKYMTLAKRKLACVDDTIDEQMGGVILQRGGDTSMGFFKK